MKAFKLLLLSSALCTLASNAMAADGTIKFTGEIIAASCVASSGAGTSVGGAPGQQVVDVNLGKVSMDSLGDAQGSNLAAATAINLSLDCGDTAEGLKTVKVAFDPMSGSGVDLKNSSLLKTEGAATGVGIGLFDDNSKLINLSANEGYTAALVKSGDDGATKYTAALNMRAGYVANGEKLNPGTATGTLPFTLTYE